MASWIMADTLTGVGVGGVSSVPAQAMANAAMSASETVSVIVRILFTLDSRPFVDSKGHPIMQQHANVNWRDSITLSE